MADPNTVANAFVQAFYNSLDSNRAQIGDYFKDVSTLSFEGDTVAGAAAIVQKVNSLGLPANATRRVTATDAQESSLGSGAIVIFITGEWMGQQYQEAYQLVPNGNNGYYVHNWIIRIGMNNPFNVPDEASEVAKQFLQFYYTTYDGGPEKRQTLGNLYSPNSNFSFEGNPLKGRDAIMARIMELPPAQHDPNMSVDVQMINGTEIVMVFVTGQESLDNSNPIRFAQMFILQKQNASYIIGNQVFRLNYG
ncbi:Nuclear transport factor 2 [Hondaea fermentalgiana]|uniref:Nuclear transport factor 2 n=1 Tax=Hondaea fermentalgiana TaxID=2315210 RepID=A0A2R5GPZ2_9STRA|nr:Nuclear transport factor 2 [Hondaea fermentalgiana]|eukprot:GBG32946.1 Nuclear transport factor 2 [Hondaea fermentalgiana]